MLPSFSYQFELKTLYCFCYPPITKSLLLGSFKKQKHKKVLEFDMSNFLNLLWFERISLLMSWSIHHVFSQWAVNEDASLKLFSTHTLPCVSLSTSLCFGLRFWSPDGFLGGFVTGSFGIWDQPVMCFFELSFLGGFGICDQFLPFLFKKKYSQTLHCM